MRIIGITGKAGAGKDTVADYLVREHGFIKYSMAKPLKDMLRVIGVPCDTQEEKASINPVFGVSNRHLAQTLGTEWMRNHVAEDGWIRLAEQFIMTQRELSRLADDGSPAGMVIADIRYDNEAFMIHDHGGQIWKIDRDSEDIAGVHISEMGIDVDLITLNFNNNRTIDSLFSEVKYVLGYRA